MTSRISHSTTEELPVVPEPRNRRAAAGHLAVVVLSGELVGHHYRLEPGVTIGRASECDILLPSPSVSRSHARIERGEDALVVVDLGSRNGISVNGVRIARHALAPGQQLLVGSIPLLVTTADAVHEQFLVEQRMAVARRITAGLAHDINNLVGVVSGSADALSRHLQRGDERRVDECLAAIKDASARMGELASKLRGDPPGRRVAIDVQTVLAEIAMMASAAASPVELELHAVKELWILCDRSAIHRAMMNLVQNALEAMRGRGGRLSIEAKRSHRPSMAKTVVEVAITDTGPGMDELTRQHIFEPYFSTKSDDTPGRGLGLTTAYETVVAHGGELEIESTPGRGTTVRIHLPFASARARHALPTSGE